MSVLLSPGALLILLATKKNKPVEEILLSIASGYKLIDRPTAI